MSNKIILALDQGTTSSRTIAYNSEGKPTATAQQDFEQLFPKNGWVEHDPEAIWQSQLNTINKVFSKGISANDVAGVGITNQRETTIVWHKDTGEPVYNAIVWQCRRTAAICDQLKNDGYEDYAVEKLGNHKPSGNFRGGKYSLLEAGTHIPFFTYWKGTIEPSTSNALVCQMDLLSSLSDLVGSAIRTEDSEDLLDVFLGKSEQGREELILEATTRTAFKKGSWVMIPPYEGESVLKEVNIEIGNSSSYQLYNLDQDISQSNNLASSNPEKLNEMIQQFEELRGDYRNTEKIELK